MEKELQRRIKKKLGMKLGFIIFWTLIALFLIFSPVLLLEDDSKIDELCIIVGIYILVILLEYTIKILKK